MAGLAVLLSWWILKGSHDFVHNFSMALYHKWGVKTGFTFPLQFLMLISDSLGGVFWLVKNRTWEYYQMNNHLTLIFFDMSDQVEHWTY